MEIKKEMELQKAKTTLEFCRRRIEGHKPLPPDVKRLNPSDISACETIQYYKRMNKTIKENFRQFLSTPDEIITLEEAGKCGPPYDNVLGNYWHKFLSDRIKGKEIEEEKDARVADLLFQKVKSWFGIVLLDSEFPLHCYMYDGEEVYFWKGDADAIGWYYNERRGQHEYVIVDWKVQRDLLGFWKKSDAYGKFLHQCLVYARLLQEHLKLHYLPAILIVPISSDNGKDILPGLFYNYPEECQSAMNDEYVWSTVPIKRSQQLPSFYIGSIVVVGGDLLS